MHPGNLTSFSYILNTTISGNFVIPPAKATVLDQFLYQDERYIQKISSNELTLRVRDTTFIPSQSPKVVMTPKPATPEATRTIVPESTPLKPTPGFQRTDIILIFLAIALLLSKIQKKT